MVIWNYRSSVLSLKETKINKLQKYQPNKVCFCASMHPGFHAFHHSSHSFIHSSIPSFLPWFIPPSFKLSCMKHQQTITSSLEMFILIFEFNPKLFSSVKTWFLRVGGILLGVVWDEKQQQRMVKVVGFHCCFIARREEKFAFHKNLKDFHVFKVSHKWEMNCKWVRKFSCFYALSWFRSDVRWLINHFKLFEIINYLLNIHNMSYLITVDSYIFIISAWSFKRQVFPKSEFSRIFKDYLRFEMTYHLKLFNYLFIFKNLFPMLVSWVQSVHQPLELSGLKRKEL